MVRSGFTMVEMLVALVVTGLLASGVIGLLLRQNDFYGQTDDLVYAEQTLRASSDLVASELRMASPLDIVEAEPDRVSFEYDLVRAVVCDVNTTTNDVFYYVVDEATNANVGAVTGVAFRDPYAATGYSYDRNHTFTRTVASGVSDAVATTCEADGGPTPTASNVSRFRMIDGWDASVGPPADGAYLRLFGRLTYEFKPSSFGSGTGLYRGNQELASPFQSDAAFSYVMSGGGVQNSTTNFANIRAVRIDATALGDGANRHDVQRDLSYVIPLRN